MKRIWEIRETFYVPQLVVLQSTKNPNKGKQDLLLFNFLYTRIVRFLHLDQRLTSSVALLFECCLRCP